MTPMQLEDAIQKYVVECRQGKLSCGAVERRGSRELYFFFGKGHAFWSVDVKLGDKLKFVSGEDLEDALYDEAVLCFNLKLADLGW